MAIRFYVVWRHFLEIITARLLPTFAKERVGKICVPHGEVPLKKLLWASLCSAGGRVGTDGIIQALCRVDGEAHF